MILGVGVDFCRVVRIRRSVERLGDAWIADIFAPIEAARCRNRPDPGIAFAEGFAVKEAVSKALGTGFAGGLRPWQVLWLGADATEPVRLVDQALARMQAIAPKESEPRVWITLGGTAALISCAAVIAV